MSNSSNANITNSPTTAAITAIPAEATWKTPTQVVVSAIEFYFPVWCVGVLVYCYLRRRCPRLFAVRQWVPSIQTSLADNQFGTLSWIWKVYSVFDSDDLRSEIGLDALCFLRLITFGFRLSVIGCINSLWLLPVYAAAARMIVVDDDGDGDNIHTRTRDALSNVSINALGDGVDRRYYIGTVVASYVLFGYAMYAILGEFQWFVRQRHAWLQHLRNLPKHLRSNVTLREHFQRLYGADRVYEVHVCVFVTQLQSLVHRREQCVRQLEHIVVEQEQQRHHVVVASSDTVRETLIEEIEQLNRKITQQIAKIERKGRPKLRGAGTVFRSSNRGSLSPAFQPGLLQPLEISSSSSSSSSSEGAFDFKNQEEAKHEDDDDEDDDDDDDTENEDGKEQIGDTKNTEQEEATTSNPDHWDAIVSAATNTRYKKKKWQEPKTTVKAAVHKATKVVKGVKDGKPDDAGFVTFTSLVAMHGALQMKQHPDLFAMETEIAPEPSDIFWNFVGKDREVLQSGRLISIALTVMLCLFWTFVVTFIVNLTDTDYLVHFFPWSAEFIEDNEGFRQFLNSLSPVLLLLFNSGLLPIILKAVSRFECPASDSTLESLAFWKMATFIVIQSFL